jgi:hypothetical protein
VTITTANPPIMTGADLPEAAPSNVCIPVLAVGEAAATTAGPVFSSGAGKTAVGDVAGVTSTGVPTVAVAVTSAARGYSCPEGTDTTVVVVDEAYGTEVDVSVRGTADPSLMLLVVYVTVTVFVGDEAGMI